MSSVFSIRKDTGIVLDGCEKFGIINKEHKQAVSDTKQGGGDKKVEFH